MTGMLYPIRSIAGNWSLQSGRCQDVSEVEIQVVCRALGSGPGGRGSARIDDYHQAGSGHEQQQPDRICLWSPLRLPLGDG